MTQNASDVVVANATAPALRADLNNVLLDITTQHSGPSAPSNTYANMTWYDTTNNILKMRNEANSAWINIGYLDQGAGAFRILDDTQVTTTSGTQTGLLGDQATSNWQAGTGTTESLVSPQKIKAAIDALAVISSGSISASGYIDVAGLRIQWGNFSSSDDGEQTVTFGTAFSTACLGVIEAGSPSDVGVGGGIFSTYSITRTNFVVNRTDSVNGTVTFYYIAIGY